MPRITEFCICILVFGCKIGIFRYCGSDFGITPIDDITIGNTWVAFGFHIASISFAISWNLFFCQFLFWRNYVYSGQLCLSERCFFVFLFMEVMSGRLRYCLIRKCAAVPIQLKIVIFHNTGWCVLIARAFVFSQLSCFCQFLMDNFGQSIMCLIILSRC